MAAFTRAGWPRGPETRRDPVGHRDLSQHLPRWHGAPDLGFWMLNDIAWVKTNPMPNFRGRRFTNAHETMIWCARSQSSKYTFNYEAMKGLNDILDTVGLGAADAPVPSGCGTTAGARSTRPKPEAPCMGVVLAATNPGDVVLDPFMGSGTTGAVCRHWGCGYIGLERDEDYAATARTRIAWWSVGDEGLVATPSKRKQPRIPFGWLVERLLTAGDILISPCQRHTARVRADGTIISADHRGSIHQVGAAVEAPQLQRLDLLVHRDRRLRIRPHRRHAPATARGPALRPAREEFAGGSLQPAGGRRAKRRARGACRGLPSAQAGTATIADSRTGRPSIRRTRNPAG